MPITQDRLLALIAAYDSAASKLQSLRATIAEAAQRPDNAEDALAAILAADAYCALDADYAAIVAREAEHFRHTQHRNRRYAARKRAARGTTSIAADDAFLAQPSSVRPSPDALAALAALADAEEGGDA